MIIQRDLCIIEFIMSPCTKRVVSKNKKKEFRFTYLQTRQSELRQV